MTKIEQFIKDHTRNYSNEKRITIGKVSKWEKQPWLTPDDAMAVAQVAREEITDKAAEWLKDFCNEHYIMSYADSHEVDTNELMEIFKKKMEE